VLKNVQINSIKDIGGLDEICDVVKNLYITESLITSLDGIEMLPNLERVWFSNHLQSLEGIQACTKIDYLEVNDNH